MLFIVATLEEPHCWDGATESFLLACFTHFALWSKIQRDIIGSFIFKGTSELAPNVCCLARIEK